MRSLDPTVAAPEVMRALGCAMYGAQLLEEAAVNLLLTVSVEGESAAASSDAIDGMVKEWERKTLGQLIEDLEATLHHSTNEGLAEDLTDVKDKRNWLAHRSLLERRDDLLDPAQHKQLIDELDIAYQSFLATADALNERSTAMEPTMTLADEERQDLVNAVLAELE